jgi:hypothetical protein
MGTNKGDRMKNSFLVMAGLILLGAEAGAQTQVGEAQYYQGPVLMQGLRGYDASFYIGYPNAGQPSCLYVTPTNPQRFDPSLVAMTIEFINFNGVGWERGSDRFATRLRPNFLRNGTIVYPLGGERSYLTRILIRNVSPNFNSIAQLIERASGSDYNGRNRVFLEHKTCPK